VIGSMVKPGGPGSDRAGGVVPGRQAVETGLCQIGWLTAELDPLRRRLGVLSLRQPGCAALRGPPPAWQVPAFGDTADSKPARIDISVKAL
jgi:hypothetical protein